MRAISGMNNETLKRRNRGLILQLIATGACASRIEIAKKTGLSKMSVSNVVAEFIEKGYVCEEDCIAVKGSGRNPVSLCIAPTAPKMIGLYVFREEIVALLSTIQLEIIDRCVISLNENNTKKLKNVLFKAIDSVMPENRDEIFGIGVGSIGPIDLRKGMLLTPPNFFGIQNFPIVSILEEHYQLPVYLDSQYNCAALAEKYYGAAKDYEDFVFLGISNGIGSGMVSGGQILRNGSGLTSEIGHISIDWNGKQCSCGNHGCLELYAGTRVIERRLQKITGKELSFREFCELSDREMLGGEAGIVLHEMAKALSCALISVVNMLNPQAVIIGHDGYWLPDRYIWEIEERMNRGKIQDAGKICVVKSAFGAETQVIGSACSLVEQVFRGEFV